MSLVGLRTIYSLLIVFFVAVAAFGDTSAPDIYGLTAPIIGITANTVVPLWEDSYMPRYDNFDTASKRQYLVYQDGKLIGATVAVPSSAKAPFLKDIHFSNVYVKSLNGITAQNVDTLSTDRVRFLPVAKKTIPFK